MRGPHIAEVSLMHATFRQSAPPDVGRGIQGTFYPSRGPGDGRAAGSAIARVAVVLMALAVARAVIGHAGRHGGGTGMSRRRQMIAELHRELHAEDAAAAEPQAKA